MSSQHQHLTPLDTSAHKRTANKSVVKSPSTNEDKSKTSSPIRQPPASQTNITEAGDMPINAESNNSKKHNAPPQPRASDQLPPIILPCPSCHASNIWQNPHDYFNGISYNCCACGRGFQRVACGVCERGVMWKGAKNGGGRASSPKKGQQQQHKTASNSRTRSPTREKRSAGFIEGQIYRCPFREQCGKPFQLVSCPSCHQMLNFKALDFLEGRDIQCDRCQCHFQKITCPRCFVALHFNQNVDNDSNTGFDIASIYKCPSCKISFQKITCSECGRLNDFQGEDKDEIGEGVYDGQAFECVHCKEKSVSLESQIEMEEIGKI
eukprot:CAMPEP_0117437186 /NCGR_PEP_ID=MMETSP0759-20121206/1394_1 /TAXON_ID=63605 /ORGANISM="Percolomonas cosmopolitus, Strain WS" /LENGTH=322 /DNA_ID=CAMNT_0005228811 /DNA_START=25 /DNA_END=993 /DNA_ORIENTATION=-